MNPGVSIVIPTWNGITLLKRFLPSVLAAASAYAAGSKAPVEIIIVDDGSTDETCSWLDREISSLKCETPTLDLRLLRNEKNLGFGHTCNRGLEAATHNLTFLLNNDVEVDPEAIAPLVENFSDPTVFAAHCRVIELESGEVCGRGKIGGFARGFFRVHRSYRLRSPHKETRGREPLYSIFASGGSAMFDREKFLKLGGFEPLLAPYYWEDVELSYRAWKHGYRVLYEPRSVARHRVSSTIGKLDRRRVRRTEQRNRLLFHWINLHDGPMLVSHIAWVILVALTAPILGKPGFLLSLADAIKLLPEARKRRGEEKRAAKLNDRDVLAVFKSLTAREDVIAYDHRSEIDNGG